MKRVYSGGDIEIDCDLDQNMQRDGRLKVSYHGEDVFLASNSYPYASRDDLPKVKIRNVEIRKLKIRERLEQMHGTQERRNTINKFVNYF